MNTIALAVAEGGSGVSNTITSSLSGITTDVLASMGGILPDAIKVLAFFIGVKLCIKLYRTITRA